MTTLGLGPHLILAYYADNGGLAPSPSPSGQPVTLTATVAAATGSPVGTVYFLSDGAVVGSGAVTNVGGVFGAQMTTSALSRGGRLLSALYLGGGAFGMSASGPAFLTVP